MFFNSLFTSIKNYIRSQISYHNTVAELSGLTDRDLKDLGISRSDIHRIAAESTEKRFEKDVLVSREFTRTLVAKEA